MWMILLYALSSVLWPLAGRAEAQGLGGTPPSAAELASARASCDALGRMPNAPMSVEACKSMLDMATRFQAAGDDPSARRPGDDALSCGAIFSELQASAAKGLSDETARRSAAVVADVTALGRRQTAELAGFMAESAALGAAASVIDAFTPNFVGAAISAAWQARFAGLAMRQAAEQAPVRARMNETTMAGMGELAEMMQANPRFVRLGQLATAKGCEPPSAPPR